MISLEKVKLILLEEYVKAQARNPNYSMRAYARKVGVSQAAISQILAGKRPLTKKSALTILKSLDKDPSEISEIISQDEGRVEKYRSIDMDSFKLISDWHYYAILSLVETKTFNSSAKWIAKRLGLSQLVAQEAIDRLVKLELLDQDKKSGQLRPTGIQFQAISLSANPALKKANRQNLELANAAIDDVDLEKRDFTAITLCFDPDRIDDARKMIQNFRRNFSRVMESGHKKDVYKLCIQLFPLTKDM
jgi:uncharacterized protein (TIGR02147 family)